MYSGIYSGYSAPGSRIARMESRYSGMRIAHKQTLTCIIPIILIPGWSQTNAPLVYSQSLLGRVRLGSIRNKNNWNNASKRLFGSYSHSGIPGFHSGYSAPRSRIAGIYSGIHSYSGIFPSERALSQSDRFPSHEQILQLETSALKCKYL